MPDEKCKAFFEHIPLIGLVVQHSPPFLNKLFSTLSGPIIIAAIGVYTTTEILKHDMQSMQSNINNISTRMENVENKVSDIYIKVEVIERSNRYNEGKIRKGFYE